MTHLLEIFIKIMVAFFIYGSDSLSDYCNAHDSTQIEQQCQLEGNTYFTGNIYPEYSYTYSSDTYTAQYGELFVGDDVYALVGIEQRDGDDLCVLVNIMSPFDSWPVSETGEAIPEVVEIWYWCQPSN